MGIRINNQTGRITLDKDTRSQILQRIMTAKEAKDRMDRITGPDKGKFDSRSERNLALVCGTYWHKVKPNDAIISTNHLASALKVKHTLITGGDTEFIPKARESAFMEIEEVAKGALNDLWDVQDYDSECDAAAWDSAIHPVGGVVELGWQYKDGVIERTGERPDELEIAEANLEESDAIPLMTPDGRMVGVPTEDFESEDLARIAMMMAESGAVGPEVDDPFIERFDPRDFFVDPSCTSYRLDDARYVFRRKWSLVSEVKANKEFKNTKDIKGSAYSLYPNAVDGDLPPQEIRDDVMRVELFDGYCMFDFDKDGRDELYHIVFAPETGKELLCELPPYPHFRGSNRYPYEIIPPAVTDNDKLDQQTDVELARDIQVSHDLALTQIEWARAHSPNILMVPTGTFDGDDGARQKRRIESGKENTVLELDPAFMQYVKWMERPAIHTDAYQSLETAPNRIMDIIGVSEFQSNMTPDKKMTATEAGQIATQGGTRQDGEIERYYDFLERVAYKVLTLLQQFSERTREYAFTNQVGDKEYGQADMFALRGTMPGTETPDNPLGELNEPGIQFAISIDVSKKRPKNEFSEKQEASELLTSLQAYSQMPDPRLPNRPLVNLPVLLRGLIAKYNLPNANEIIPPDPTPEEIMQFQMEQAQQMAMQQQQEAQNQQMEQEKGQADMQNKAADRDTKMQIEQMRLQGRGNNASTTN